MKFVSLVSLEVDLLETFLRWPWCYMVSRFLRWPIKIYLSHDTVDPEKHMDFPLWTWGSPSLFFTSMQFLWASVATPPPESFPPSPKLSPDRPLLILHSPLALISMFRAQMRELHVTIPKYISPAWTSLMVHHLIHPNAYSFSPLRGFIVTPNLVCSD